MDFRKCKAAGVAAAVFLSLSLPSKAGEYQASNVREAGDTLRLTLSEVFSRIETENRTMEMLRSAQEASDEGVKAARNARLPELNAELNVSYIGDAFLTDRDFSNFTKAPSPHFGNGFTLEAQQVVYAGGAVNAGIQIAEKQASLASAQIDKSRQGLRLMAAGQCIDLFRIDNNIKVYNENISLTEKLIAEIQAKREQGLALANDVTRYELRLEMLKLELVRMKNNAAVLNYRLCNTLGLPEGTVVTLALSEPEDMRTDSHFSWQDRAEQTSPELKIADVNADIAVAQRQIVRSERLPKIAIVAHEDFNGPITFEIPPIDKNLNLWYVGLGIRYEFGSLYKSGHKLKQATIAARQAEQARDVSKENLQNDVQQSFTNYQQAYIELETQEKSLQLANENYNRVHDRYIEQLVLVTDMLDAFNMKLDAELGVADAKAEIEYRLCRLKYAAGVL